MKVSGPFILSCLFLLLVSACGNDKNEERLPDARSLYEKSLNTTLIYIDSLRLAPDSATVARIIRNHEEAITKLNYSYSSDLSLQFTEGENDTLTTVTIKYVSVRDSMLRSIFYRQKHANDSLPITDE